MIYRNKQRLLIHGIKKKITARHLMNKEKFLQRDSAYLSRTKRARNIRLAILAIAYLPESIITRVEFNFHTGCWRFDILKIVFSVRSELADDLTDVFFPSMS